MKAIFGEPLDATVFKGHLNNGLPIEAEGTLLSRPGGWNRDRGTAATFGLTGDSRLTVGRPDDTAAWRFAITNLPFSVPAARQREASGAGPETLPLALPDGTVTIEQVPDYDHVRRELRGRHAVRVTGEACVPRSVPFDIARELVSDLCSVLSLADGTLVNWIFCEQRDADDNPLFAVHHLAVTRRYNGALPLIDPRPPQEADGHTQTAVLRLKIAVTWPSQRARRVLYRKRQTKRQALDGLDAFRADEVLRSLPHAAAETEQ